MQIQLNLDLYCLQRQGISGFNRTRVKMPCPLLIFSQSDYLIQVVIYLLLKPTDLDLHCLQGQGIPGFSRTRIKAIPIKRDLWRDMTCTDSVHPLYLQWQQGHWYTVNPLYTDTRYNDKIRYNDNLNVMKHSLRRWRLMKNYAKTLHKIFKQHMFWYLLESPQRGSSNKYPKHNVLWGNKNKTSPFLHHSVH